MTTSKVVKMNPTQLNEAVAYLMKLVAIGNGEPSLKEIIRYQGMDIKEIKKETTERFIGLETKIAKTNENFEKSLEDAKQRELETWKERYENLVKRHTNEELAEKRTRTYWVRLVVGLVLAQLIQFGLSYFIFRYFQ